MRLHPRRKPIPSTPPWRGCSSDAKELMLLHTKDLHPMGIRPPQQGASTSRWTCSATTTSNWSPSSARAGTGKTLLALACGLELALNDKKIRKGADHAPHHAPRQRHRIPPRQHGGTSSGHWMKPIHDNLAYLLSLKGGGKLEKTGERVPRIGHRRDGGAHLHPRPLHPQTSTSSWTKRRT